MRKVMIDLSCDTSSPLSAFGGYEGEHNATELTLLLPERLLEGAGEYYMIFEIGKSGQTVFSAPLYPAGGKLCLLLPRQVMVAPSVGVHAALYRREGETLSEIAKSGRVYLEIKFPEMGDEVEMNGDGGQIPGLVVDQVLLADSSNPVSGKAVSAAVEEVSKALSEAKAAHAHTARGRSAKYSVSQCGWKRILQVSPSDHGTVDLGLVQGDPNGMTSVLGFDFSGFARDTDDSDGGGPVFLKRYENAFGQSGALEGQPCRVTALRVGFPRQGEVLPENEKALCYVDVYVDFKDKEVFLPLQVAEKDGYYPEVPGRYWVQKVENFSTEDGTEYFRVSLDSGYWFEWYDAGGLGDGGLKAGDSVLYDVSFDETYGKIWKVYPESHELSLNYAGFADPACEPISEETVASEFGVYGETLAYYTVDVAKMPCYLTDSDKVALQNAIEPSYELITCRTFADIDMLSGAIPEGKSEAWREKTLLFNRPYKAMFFTLYFDVQSDKSATRDMTGIFQGNKGGSCYLGIYQAMTNTESRYTRGKIERKNGLWWLEYTMPTKSSGDKVNLQTTLTGFGFARDRIYAPDGTFYENHLASDEGVSALTLQMTMPSSGSGRENPVGMIAIYGIPA